MAGEVLLAGGSLSPGPPHGPEKPRETPAEVVPSDSDDSNEPVRTEPTGTEPSELNKEHKKGPAAHS